MKQHHRNQPEIVRDEKEELAEKRLQEFRDQIEWLALKHQRNELQKKLMGCALDERLDAFTDIQINITERHPEVLPGLIEERDNFLQAVGIPVKEYQERYDKDLAGRKAVNAPPSGPETPADPSVDHLKVLHEEIKEQRGATPDNLPHLEPDPEPAIEISDPESGEPLTPVVEEEIPEPDFSDPTHPANQHDIQS